MTKTPLKRVITLPLLTFYGLGNILGAGIYVLIGKVAGNAGYFTPVSFFLASLVALFSTFTYAELSARYPVSAGESVYLYKGFGLKSVAAVAGLMLVAAGIVSAAAIAHGFVGYLQLYIDVPEWLGLSFPILLLGVVAVIGIKESVLIAAVLTVIEIIGLCMIIWVARDHITIEPARIQLSADDIEWAALTGSIFLGSFLAFYAFLGFEDIVNIAEEVKNPQRTLPMALLLALLIATVLYVLVSLSALSVMPPQELAETTAPLAIIFERASSSSPVWITLISLCAVINGALIQIIMASRVLYGLSCNQWIPGWFATVHPKTQTPVTATVCVTITIIIASLSLPLVELAEATSFLILAVFAMVNITLILVKRKEPSPENVTTYPIWIPYIGALFCLAFILLKLIIG